MDYLSLTHKYRHDHNNPLIKVEAFGLKQFLSTLTKDQEQRKDKCLKDIEAKLKHARVERRLARSVAEWLPEQGVAKTPKLIGLNFGIHTKKDKILNRLETAFLLETNKLELMHLNTPVSITHAFTDIINSNCLLKKYLVYKKLLLQGHKLKKYEETSEIKTKHKLPGLGAEPAPKVPRLETSEHQPDFGEVFKRLRRNGPQTFQSGDEGYNPVPDYYIQSDNSDCLNLFIKEEFDSRYSDGAGSNICGSFSGDDVSVYRFINVNVPTL